MHGLGGLLVLGLAFSSDDVRIVETELSDDALEYRRSLPEAPPPLRGFRAPALDRADEQPPFLPDAADDLALQEGVRTVVRELASEGLCTTLVHTVEALGPDTVQDATRVREAGLPVDLLRFFRWNGTEGNDDPDVFVHTVAERLRSGTTADELIAELAGATFAFRPSGFRAASESGENEAHTLRVQFTRSDTWLGDGDGGNLDLTRQVLDALPEADVIGSVEGRFFDDLLETLDAWPLEQRSGRMTLTKEALVVAQWAQDNGKAGYLPDGDDWTIGTLVPRYACRGEGGTSFVPGETYIAESLATAGHAVVRSPLLFQGGNLLVANDPAANERVMLLGEAEIFRNVGLGLTEEQVLAAFRAEFDVARVVVLPAASFHIDAEVSLRSHDGQLIAFVNDDTPAIQIVLKRSIDALAAGDVLDANAAASARQAVDNRDWASAVPAIGAPLGAQALSVGVYPESFAKLFETDKVDPGPANLQTFLFALDRVTGQALSIDALPDPHAQAYLRSFERMERDRQAIHAELERNGWRVVRVPSLAGGGRGRNYVNALHDRTRSLIPAYGGLFEELDRAAREVYETTLGSAVRVLPIRSAESQRRSGAVHCSVALYPAP